ncbi:unnamed protein product [Urochloa humidicola]
MALGRRRRSDADPYNRPLGAGSMARAGVRGGAHGAHAARVHSEFDCNPVGIESLQFECLLEMVCNKITSILCSRAKSDNRTEESPMKKVSLPKCF